MRSIKTIHVVSCHAEGEVGDVIVGGVNPPPGETLYDQSRFIATDNELRQFVLNEPRDADVLRTSEPATDPMQSSIVIGKLPVSAAKSEEAPSRASSVLTQAEPEPAATPVVKQAQVAAPTPTPTPAMLSVSLGALYPMPPNTCLGTIETVAAAAIEPPNSKPRRAGRPW